LSEKGSTYIFNHLTLILGYHKGTAASGNMDGRIVRAHVQLASCDTVPACSKPMKIPPGSSAIPDKFEIPYTYTVLFEVREGTQPLG